MCLLLSTKGHSLANSLSTRQLLRICKRLAVNKDECLHQVVNKACLSRSLLCVYVLVKGRMFFGF